ncbi:hypothetical protein OSL60_26395, partial [Escherichia coli]|nr:hypothetical protein [Escherichia coli]
DKQIVGIVKICRKGRNKEKGKRRRQYIVANEQDHTDQSDKKDRPRDFLPRSHKKTCRDCLENIKNVTVEKLSDGGQNRPFIEVSHKRAY